MNFSRIFDKAVDYAAWIGGALIVIQTFSTGLHTLSGYFFGKTISGMMAITEFQLLYITFLSSAWLLKTDGHVVVDTITSHFSQKLQNISNFIIYIISMGICAIWVIWGSIVAFDHLINGIDDYFKIPGFPIGGILIAIPIGGLLLFGQFLKKTVRIWKEVTAPPEVTEGKSELKEV